MVYGNGIHVAAILPNMMMVAMIVCHPHTKNPGSLTATGVFATFLYWGTF
jgi:hypothetical protein